MQSDVRQALRQLPSVDEVLRSLTSHPTNQPRWALVRAIREQIDALREQVLSGQVKEPRLDPHAIYRRAEELIAPSLQPVLNATGVVLHTNLGRAPLSLNAIRRVEEVAKGFCNLEYELENRRRGSRHTHMIDILSQLTGAEDALVVNNNAAAILLCFMALAQGREVVVSRGELVEIGGSFRLPDIMVASGTTLREVGTTNRTHLRDYAKAINENTGLLLKVHRSNFTVMGFVAEVEPAELAALGRSSNIPTMFDLGSGSLLDLAELGLPSEPTIQQAIQCGFDLVTFSGDKILGGPQAGIILGRSGLLNTVRSHALMRAVRPDKMTLAALEATLVEYRDGNPRSGLPVLAMLGATESSIKRRARRLRTWLDRQHLSGWSFPLIRVISQVGGGALPQAAPQSWGVALAHPSWRPDIVEQHLRQADPPIIGRIENHQILLDMRTILDDQVPLVEEGILQALHKLEALSNTAQ